MRDHRSIPPVSKSLSRPLTILALAVLSILLSQAMPAGADVGGCCQFVNPPGGCQTTSKVACKAAIELGQATAWLCNQACVNEQCVPGQSTFVCEGGTRHGKDCQENADCPGGICKGRVFPRCSGGLHAGDICASNADCEPGGVCDEDDVGAPAVATMALGAARVGDAQDSCPTCELCEEVAPSCGPMVRLAGTPVTIRIPVQDTGSGLHTINVLVAENASVSTPSFSQGTTSQVVVTAVKQDQTKASRVELRVTDRAGNFTLCDPILTTVVRGTGKPASETHTGLDAVEDTVTIDNGAPGLRNLEVVVNGVVFRVAGLGDGRTRTLDVSSALLPGPQNIFTLRSHGRPGSSASVLIWDGGE